MTLVRWRLREGDGTLVGGPNRTPGSVFCSPNQRYTDATGLVLPVPFQLTLNGVELIRDVAPSTDDFCWKFREEVAFAGVIRHCKVPAWVLVGGVETPINYEALIDIDPLTFDPIVALPGWTSVKIAAQTAAAAAAAASSAADAVAAASGAGAAATAAVAAAVPAAVATAVTAANLPGQVTSAVAAAGLPAMVASAVVDANIPGQVTTAANLAVATAISNLDKTVSHLANPATVRPSTTGKVSWYGSVYPANLIAGDILYLVTQVAAEPPIAWHSVYSASGLALADLALVPTWADASGNGHTLSQATPGSQPAFRVAAGGVPAFVRFDGARLMQTAAFSAVLGQPGTVCLALRMTSVFTSGTAVKRVFDGLASEWIFQQRNNAGVAVWSANAGSTVNASNTTPAVAGAWTIVTVIYSGSGSSIRINGHPTTANLGSLTLSGLTLGGKFDNTNRGDFDLGDLRIYSGLLSSGQLGATEQFLADRYSVTLVP